MTLISKADIKTNFYNIVQIIIDIYVKDLNKNGILFKNIKFKGKTLNNKEEIKQYLYNLDQSIKIPNKMELTSKWLLQEIRKHQRREIYEDWVLDEVQLLD